ncbi:unnamed protein product, partial [Polarella glacialis]
AFDHSPEVDRFGRRKVFKISGGYLGVYRDEQGNLIDVRPVEGRPSYDQLMLRSESDLHRLVVAAWGNQLKELESRPSTGATFEEQRKTLRREVAEAKRRSAFALSFMSKAPK